MHIFIALTAALFAAGTGYGDEFFVREASAIARVFDRMVIASDETGDGLWVLNGGNVTFAPFVDTYGNPTGPIFDDLEALAAAGGANFFALTSQRLTKKGERRPEREQLARLRLDLTDANAPKAIVINRFPLRDTLVEHIQTALAGRVNMADEKTGGLNIEGITYFRGNLHFGLRRPLALDGSAVVLTLRNAFHTFQSPVNWGRAYFVGGANGFGIRSLSNIGGNFVALLGYDGGEDEPPVFRLHHLNQGRDVHVPGLDQLVLPEGIEFDPFGRLWVVQDLEAKKDGDWLVAF